MQKPSTRLLISSVNAAWNGDRVLCSNSTTMARVIAASTGPSESCPERPSAGTRAMATLVATTNPSGSTPMTRFSNAATVTAGPACGTMRMIDHQLCQRALPQLRTRATQTRTVRNIRKMNHKTG